MRKYWMLLILVIASSFALISGHAVYKTYYINSLNGLEQQLLLLSDKIQHADISTPDGVIAVKGEIETSRRKLKRMDLWLRYFEPIAYKKVNGPLPVEWENEVFEKYEKPYRRDGAGLSLAEIYLNRPDRNKDSLLHLVQIAVKALSPYRADSITGQLDTFHHFFLCNRLYLLNLSAIYTTGFECPGNDNIIPELREMLKDVKTLYGYFNESFPGTPLTKEYLDLYDRTIAFAEAQPSDFTQFDNYHFIKNYVNPLFALNQKMIVGYNVFSSSFNDFTLNNECNSIFDKGLYTPQNSKGIYSLVTDKDALKEIKAVGKMLFFDPILSGNNRRSCASCHKPTQYYTENAVTTSFQFDGTQRLARNTPTLVDVTFNHLLMLDGRLTTLQEQGKAVITNPIEMGGNEQAVMEKVLSCKEYRNAFKKFLKYTPEEKEITFNHIVSAITYYYSEYSDYYSPFDDAMNHDNALSKEAIAGFNVFMGKGQCGTCHYVPQFNGVPPPYIGSEFEVLGVPADTLYRKLDNDSGRFKPNPAFETVRSFRTGSLRNIEFTGPYMHNGVFTSLSQVIDFYDGGGAAGRKMNISNQTLSADSLKLTPIEKSDLLSFLHSLNENIIFEGAPQKLPESSEEQLNKRKVGGEY